MTKLEEYMNKGYITYDEESLLYTVWDETSAYPVGSTYYGAIAVVMHDEYCKYLEGM